MHGPIKVEFRDTRLYGVATHKAANVNRIFVPRFTTESRIRLESASDAGSLNTGFW